LVAVVEVGDAGKPGLLFNESLIFTAISSLVGAGNSGI